MRTPRSLSAFAAAVTATTLLLLFSGSTPAQISGITPAEPYRPEAAWERIEILMTEGSYEEALAAAARLREAARMAGDEANVTRALVQEVQLRSLDFELVDAYQALRQAEWPRNTADRAILHLYAAVLLDRYYDSRRWQIDQRERITRAEGEALDLEKATRSEIYAAALEHLGAVWQRRAELSEIPLSRVYRYLIPNDYPLEVRGTLRDAASYQLAGLLADSAFWTVEEAQDLPRSELRRLMAPSPWSAWPRSSVTSKRGTWSALFWRKADARGPWRRGCSGCVISTPISRGRRSGSLCASILNGRSPRSGTSPGPPSGTPCSRTGSARRSARTRCFTPMRSPVSACPTGRRPRAAGGARP